VIIGWLFTLIVSGVQHSNIRQEDLVERVSRIEVSVAHQNDRMDTLSSEVIRKFCREDRKE